MQIPSRFTVAVHTLLCIAYFHGDCKVTSDFIAKSVNVNPVVIRRTLGKLKEAGLVNVEAGVGGASLAKDACDITLLDAFEATGCADDNLFGFHGNPNANCPVGRSVHPVLDGKLAAAEQALYDSLAQTTIADLLEDTKHTLVEN